MLACNRRQIRRPCSLPRVSATSRYDSRIRSFVGGKSRLKFGGNRFAERVLVVLYHKEIVPAVIEDLEEVEAELTSFSRYAIAY